MCIILSYATNMIVEYHNFVLIHEICFCFVDSVCCCFFFWGGGGGGGLGVGAT